MESVFIMVHPRKWVTSNITWKTILQTITTLIKM